MSLLGRYGPAIDRAACDVMRVAGSSILGAGAGSIALGGLSAGPAGAVAAGALALYAANIACPYDQGGEGPTGGTYCGLDMSRVCTDVEVGDHVLKMETWDGSDNLRQYSRLLSIGCAYAESDEPVKDNWYSHYREITSDDGPGTEPFTQAAIFRSPGPNPNSVILFSEQVPIDGVPSECKKQPRVEPWEGQDEDGCNITIQIAGMGVTPGGNVAPIAIVEPGHQKQKWLDEQMYNRPEPGTISDNGAVQHKSTCNMAPTLVYHDGDKYYGVPITPGEDWQEALDRLNKELSGQISDVKGDIGDVDDKLDEILDKLPEDGPGEPISIPSGTVTFRAVCDKDDQGNLEQVEYELGGATTTNQALEQIYSNQTKLFAMLQQHLNWKTPVCGPVRPELEGRFVTIHFESAKNSPGGGRPLRKLFRYRTLSARSVGQLRDYWREFVWNAGPYCVIHSGHTWGTPQVWASSPDEGKRVIQHAAREAGFDSNQVGKWTVSGSDYTRYGMSGEMSITKRFGKDWLTSREGPSGF